MAEIKNTLSIDTSGAIQSLSKLEDAMSKFGNRVKDFVGQLSQVSKGIESGKFDQAAKSVDNLSKSMNKVSTAAAKMGSDAAAGTNKAKMSAQQGAQAFDKLGLSVQQLEAKSRGAGTSLSKGLKGAQTAANSLAGSMGKLSASVKGALSGAIARVRAFRKEWSTAMKANSKSMGSFAKNTESAFQSFGRVMTTQALIGGLNAANQAMQSASKGALDFKTKVNEINAILGADDPLKNNLSELEQYIKRVSDQFAIPLDQAAEGVYQAISTQIGDTASALEFLNNSAKLAQVTQTELGATVRSLSGALQAYGLSADESAAYTDKFITAIQLGNTTLAEFAPALGQIAPTANLLGISIEELFAQLATLTRLGIPTSQAVTQIRGELQALIKPSEFAADIMSKMGVNAKQLVAQTGGLYQALQALIGRTDGTAESIGKIVPRIRGLTGAIITTQERAGQVADALGMIGDAAGRLDTEWATQQATAAQKVQQNYQALQNAMEVGLGGVLVDLQAWFFDTVASGEQLGKVFSVLAPAASLLGKAFIAVSVGMFAINQAVTFSQLPAVLKVFTALKGLSLAAMFKTLAGAIAALASPIGIVVAAIAAIGTTAYIVYQDWKAQNEELRSQMRERFKEMDEASNKWAEAEKKRIDQVQQRFVEAMGEMVEAARKRVDRAIAMAEEEIGSFEDIAEAGEQMYENMIQAGLDFIGKQLEGFKKVEKEAASIGKSAQKELDKLNMKQFDSELEQSIAGFDDVGKAVRVQQAAQQAALKATEQLRKANTKAEYDAAKAAADHALKLADQAVSLGESSGNMTALNNAANARIGIEGQIKRALEEQVKKQAEIEKAAKQRTDAAKQEFENLKELAKQAFKDIKFTDADGKALMGDALDAAEAKARERSRQLIEAMLNTKNFNNAKFAQELIPILQGGVDRASTDTQVKLTKFIIEKGSVKQAIQSQVDSVMGQIKAEMPILAKLAIAGKQFDSPREFINFIAGDMRTEMERLNKQGLELKLLQDNELKKVENVEQEMQNVDKVIQSLEGRKKEGLFVNEDVLTDLKEIRSRWNEIKTQIEKGVVIDPQILDSFGSQLTAFKEEHGGLMHDILEFTLGPGLMENLGIIGEALVPLKTSVEAFGEGMRKAGEAAPKLEGLPETMGSLGEVMVNLGTDFTAMGEGAEKTNKNMDPAAKSTKSADESAKTLSDSMDKTGKASETYKGGMEGGKNAAQTTNLAGLIGQVNSLASAAERYAAAMAAGGGGAATAAIGRFMYRADGGTSGHRGTDTIPAMLSPGEYVVNAKSTRRFFSQLQAINAGHQPVYRQEGGPVNTGDTITIGDISITDPGQQETVKEFARKVKREARKGSFGSGGIF